MAKEKKEKPKKEKAAKSRKGLPLAALIPLALAAAAALPVTLVVVAGMLPGIVTALTDRNPKRNLTVAVASLNLASTLYVVFLLLKRGFSLDYALQLLSAPVHYAIMWGGAGLGLALMRIIPPAVAQMLASLAEIKIRKYRDNQAEMKKMWSEEVGL